MEADLLAQLPNDLQGQTLLDVGCGGGAVARAAADRGAARVVAIDIDDDHVFRARSLLGNRPSVEILDADAEVELPNGPFDHVVCRHLLARSRNPIALLDRLVACTGRTLILVVDGLGEERSARLLRRDHGAMPPLIDVLEAMPLMLVGRNGTPRRKREQKFYFSREAVHHLLMEHRRQFASCETINTTTPGRFLVRAVRRQVGHLVVVAGPTGTGKTTFLERARCADSIVQPVLAAADLADADRYETANSDRLSELGPSVPRLLYHYDLLRTWQRDAGVPERDEGLDVVDCSQRLTVITLVARPAILRRRLTAELRLMADPNSRTADRRRQVLKLYADPERLVDRVTAWLRFVAKRGADSHLVDASDGYRLLASKEWRAVIRSG